MTATTIPTQTAASAATDLGISLTTLYRWIKNGQLAKHGLAATKVDGRWVITLLEDAGKLTAPAAPEAPAEQPAADLETQIRAVYAELAADTDAWISLTKIRQRLTGTRTEQDAALRSMERKPDVALVPEANQKALTGQDRDAAVNIGEQDKHLIWIAA